MKGYYDDVCKYENIVRMALNKKGLCENFLYNSKFDRSRSTGCPLDLDPEPPMKHTIYKHVIIAKERKKFLGISPYDGNGKIVAEITSEPKVMEKRKHYISGSDEWDYSLLRYSGLEIKVLDVKYQEKIEMVTVDIEREVGEKVKIIKD